MNECEVCAFISSPFQLLNAWEYCLQHEAASDVFYVGDCASLGAVQVRKTADLLGVRLKMQTCKECDLERYVRRHCAGKSYSRVIIGDVRDYHLLSLVSQLKVDHCVIIDDGNSSLRLPDIWRRQKSIVGRLKNVFCSLGFLQVAVLPSGAALFTMYDGLEPFCRAARWRFEPNNFRGVKARANSGLPKGRVALLVGGCQVELGILPQDRYFRMVSDAQARSGGEVVYIPHRRESAEKLELLRRYGMNVSAVEYPLELHLALLNPREIHLYGFYSTIFDSVPRIFEDRKVAARIYQMDPQHVKNEMRAELVRLVYPRYEKYHGYEIVEAP